MGTTTVNLDAVGVLIHPLLRSIVGECRCDSIVNVWDKTIHYVGLPRTWQDISNSETLPHLFLLLNVFFLTFNCLHSLKFPCLLALLHIFTLPCSVLHCIMCLSDCHQVAPLWNFFLHHIRNAFSPNFQNHS